MRAWRSPSEPAPPSILTPAGIGYGPRSDSSAYSKRTALIAWPLPTTVIGIPIGPPSQRPAPKSACIVFVAPIALTVAAEPAATGSRSMRRFQALSLGNTGHDFAVGSGDPHELVAAAAAAIAVTRTNARTDASVLTLILSATPGRTSSLEPGRRRPR